MKQGIHTDDDYKRALRSELHKGMTPKEKARWRDIERKYGINHLQYNKMLKAQNNVCLGCQTFSKKMCVDHDHITGKIRGLLCSDCNTILGLAKDNPTVLNNLSKYVRKHNKKRPSTSNLS